MEARAHPAVAVVVLVVVKRAPVMVVELPVKVITVVPTVARSMVVAVVVREVPVVVVLVLVAVVLAKPIRSVVHLSHTPPVVVYREAPTVQLIAVMVVVPARPARIPPVVPAVLVSSLFDILRVRYMQRAVRLPPVARIPFIHLHPRARFKY